MAVKTYTTDTEIKHLNPSKNPNPEKSYPYPVGNGLYLVVNPNGSKYWHFRYRFDNKQKTLALGVYNHNKKPVSLKQALKSRDAAIELLAKGIDPSQAKKEKKQQKAQQSQPPVVINPFHEIALKWWQDKKHKKNLSAHHANKILSYLEKDTFPHLGNKPIADITTPDIRHVVRSVEERGAHDVASRQLQNIKSIFNYAIEWGYVTYNPAQPLTVTKPEQQHRPSLKVSDLPLFFERLNTSSSNPEIILAVKLCIYTFCRPETIRFARWADFDVEAKRWNVPAQYMKMKTEHIVPLSPQILAILEALKPHTGRYEFLFYNPSSQRPISENTMNLCINRIGYKGIATPSGFRSTACSLLNEKGFNSDAIERQMAHMERNKVRAAYIHHAQYMEERTKMMDFWGAYLEQQEKRNNVIPVNFHKESAL